jgi:hypothetical protein
MDALSTALPSIILALLVTELYIWLPRLSRWIVKRCVLRLPEALQERYREEWEGTFSELPSSILLVVHALSLVLSNSSQRISQNYYEAEIQNSRMNLVKFQHQNKIALKSIEELRIAWTENLSARQSMTSSLNNTVIEVEIMLGRSNINEALAKSVEASCKEFIGTIFENAERASTLLELSVSEAINTVDGICVDLDLAQDLILKASALSTLPKSRPMDLDSILRELHQCFRRVECAREWELDKPRHAEISKLTKAVEAACLSLPEKIKSSHGN